MTASKIVFSAASAGGEPSLEEPVVVAFEPNATNSSTPNLHDQIIAKADSDGNVYVAGRNTESGDGSYLVTKFDDAMSKQWAKDISTCNCVRHILVSSDESKIFVIGFTETSTISSGPDLFILEFAASDGTLNNSIQMATASDRPVGSVAAFLESDDNIVISHANRTTTQAKQVITRIDTSDFTVDTSRIVDYEGIYPEHITKYGDDFYISSNYLGSGDYVTVQKCSVSTLEVSASKRLTSPKLDTNADDFNLITGSGHVNSSGDFYQIAEADNDAVILAKYNSSLALQSTTKINHSDTSTYTVSDNMIPISMAMDSKDNLYLMMRTNSDHGAPVIYIQKRNSSGTVEWLRSIQALTIWDSGYRFHGNISIAPNDNSFVVAFAAASHCVVGRFPINGDGAGCYRYFIYGDDNMPYGTALTETAAGIGSPADLTTTSSTETYTTKAFAGTISNKSNEYTNPVVNKVEFPTGLKVVGVFGQDFQGHSTAHRYIGIPDNLEDDDLILGMVTGADYTGISVSVNIATSQFTDDGLGARSVGDTYDNYARAKRYIWSSSTNPTEVELAESRDAQNSQVFTGLILRGVDTTTPQDFASMNSDTKTSRITPDMKTITPVTDGALIVAQLNGSGSFDQQGVYLDNAGEYDMIFGHAAADTADAVMGVFVKVWRTADGTFSPSSPTSTIPTSTSFCSSSMLTAWRPAT